MSGTNTQARHRLTRPTEQSAAEISSRPSFLGVLRNVEFRAVWLADAQSSLGDQLSRTALAVLVYQRTHSPFLTALIYAVTFLPALFSGVLLGGLADRFPHRSTLVRCNLARAGLVAAMVVPGVPIAALVLLVIASTIFAAPFDSANSAMLADIFDGEEYTFASSLRSMTHQVAQLLGFATGGLLLIALSPRSALAIDALTFIVAAVIVRAAVHLRARVLRRLHGRRDEGRCDHAEAAAAARVRLVDGLVRDPGGTRGPIRRVDPRRDARRRAAACRGTGRHRLGFVPLHQADR
jgi:MFS family permease